jgi:hypothetical protein
MSRILQLVVFKLVKYISLEDETMPNPLFYLPNKTLSLSFTFIFMAMQILIDLLIILPLSYQMYMLVILIYVMNALLVPILMCDLLISTLIETLVLD